jgi:hypothetical protein
MARSSSHGGATPLRNGVRDIRWRYGGRNDVRYRDRRERKRELQRRRQRRNGLGRRRGRRGRDGRQRRHRSWSGSRRRGGRGRRRHGGRSAGRSCGNGRGRGRARARRRPWPRPRPTRSRGAPRGGHGRDSGDGPVRRRRDDRLGRPRRLRDPGDVDLEAEQIDDQVDGRRHADGDQAQCRPLLPGGRSQPCGGLAHPAIVPAPARTATVDDSWTADAERRLSPARRAPAPRPPARP